MRKEFAFVTDDTVANLLRNATAKWIVHTLDKNVLNCILDKYDVSNMGNQLAAIVDIRKQLSILPPSCESQILSEITVCDDLFVKLEKVDDTKLLLYVIHDGVRYPLTELNPAEIGWENYSMRSIGSGNSKSGDAYVSLAIAKVEEPASELVTSMEVSFKFYKTGNKEVFHVSDWEQDVPEYYVFDAESDNFKLCSAADIIVKDTRKVLNTLQLLDVITLKLLKNSHSELCLQVSFKDTVVLEECFSQNYTDCDKYFIEDIQSGISIAGDYYLSVAVSVDDLSPIPEAREIAIIVKKGGSAQVEDINRWDNSESRPYYVFDKEYDGFTLMSNFT